MFDKLIVAVISVTILFTVVISIETMVKHSGNAGQVIASDILTAVK